MIDMSPYARRVNSAGAPMDGNVTRITHGTLWGWLIVLALIAGPLFLSGCAPAFAGPSVSFGIPSDSQVRSAMDSYRATHPVCEACGKPSTLISRLEVHHIRPQHAFPALAANTNNFCMLCRADHIQWGHAGDGSCHRYVENLREVLAARIIKENRP